jgi:two-component system sensor histidine kinase UhpB
MAGRRESVRRRVVLMPRRRPPCALPSAAVAAQERQRMARDLHDELGNLAVLKLYLAQVSASLKAGRTLQALRKLEEAAALLGEAMGSLRGVMLDRDPAVLDLGLPKAVGLTARQFSERTGIKVHLRASALPSRLPHAHETALFRVLQGALSNVLRHARAENATVTLTAAAATTPGVVLTVEDDGVGFGAGEATTAASFGLTAMRERAEALGGRFRVESWPARGGDKPRGTRIEVELPLSPGQAT